MGTVRVGVMGYADDVALLAKSATATQRALDAVASLLTRCGMQLNASKCEYAFNAMLSAANSRAACF